MNYYFTSGNSLHISGSEFTGMLPRVKKIYEFKHIELPLGGGFSEFLNIDIEKWGNSFKSLIIKMIKEYDEGNLSTYIAEAKKIFSEIAYFSVYHEYFYNEIIPLNKHKGMVIDACKKMLEFLETKETDTKRFNRRTKSIKNVPHVIRGEIDRLKEIQNLFIKLSNLCLSPDNNNPLESLFENQEMTMQEMYYKLENPCPFGFRKINSVPNIQIRYEVNQLSSGEYGIVEVHTTSDIYNICYEEFIMLIKNNFRVKRCGNENCKKYFVPEYRFDTIYCNDCKSAGISIKVYQEKLRENPALMAYNKVYQSKYAKLVKPHRGDLEKKKKALADLKKWRDEAKSKIDLIKSLDGKERDAVYNDFITWLNE